MLATPAKPGTLITDLKGWVFDTKIDGIRCLAQWDGNSLRLVNRSGRDITAQFPELDFASDVLEQAVGGLPLILDGEIVARSGSFQDTAKRAKQVKPDAVLATMKQIPISFVAFDVIYLGTDVRHATYVDRRTLLDGLALPDDGIWTRSVVSMDPAFFEQVKALGMEGVIAKQPRSRYRGGRFSDWTKFKATRTLTAIAYGYDPGTGARAHFGAMKLALISDAGQPVDIGRVGTGMTASEITMLKGELDAGRPVVVEIECLNKSKDGILRFPVYLGVRTDLSVADATMSQLDDIPEM